MRVLRCAALPLIAGCWGHYGGLEGNPGGGAPPCDAYAVAPVPAEEAPFDVAAVSARSGTRVATGARLDGATTEVAVRVDVDEDLVWHSIAEDAECVTVERWEVGMQVAVATPDGVLDVAWADRAEAARSSVWSLGTVLGEAETAALLEDIAAPGSAANARVAVEWGTGDDVVGWVEAPMDDEEEVLLLQF